METLRDLALLLLCRSAGEALALGLQVVLAALWMPLVAPLVKFL